MANPNIAQQRIVAAKKTKLKPGKAATKATNVRKRSFPSEEVKQTDHFGRARVNSMSKEVNVKLKSTKQPSESFGRVPTLSGNRGKELVQRIHQYSRVRNGLEKHEKVSNDERKTIYFSGLIAICDSFGEIDPSDVPVKGCTILR